jgi:hypothetical protein
LRAGESRARYLRRRHSTCSLPRKRKPVTHCHAVARSLTTCLRLRTVLACGTYGVSDRGATAWPRAPGIRCGSWARISAPPVDRIALVIEDHDAIPRRERCEAASSSAIAKGMRVEGVCHQLSMERRRLISCSERLQSSLPSRLTNVGHRKEAVARGGADVSAAPLCHRIARTACPPHLQDDWRLHHGVLARISGISRELPSNFANRGTRGSSDIALPTARGSATPRGATTPTFGPVAVPFKQTSPLLRSA